MGDLMSTHYAETYQESQKDPEGFWSKAASVLHWYKPWVKVIEGDREQGYQWFSGAVTNTCYNAVDRHVDAGNGDRLALIYDSPVSNTLRHYSYSDLQQQVAKLAAAFQQLGVIQGDRVVIYMPMVPEAVFAMLACARIGAVHCVVFGGFADNELAKRIEDAQPSLVVSASCGLEADKIVEYKPLLDRALQLSTHKPLHCLVLQRAQCKAILNPDIDVDWQQCVDSAAAVDCLPVAATDPLYILYTSGTTGVPKGVVRDNGGHMVALCWSMQHIYGVSPGDVYWAASDIGWVVGHSYIVYAPLLCGGTTVLYEGKPVGTPDAGAFWRVIEQHKVKTLFTAPTALRAIKREDLAGDFVKRYDLSSLKTLFLAGERADPDSIRWAEQQLKIPVIDHWWQTETGWPAAANFAGLGLLAVKHGSAGLPVPGFDIRVLDDNDTELAPGTIGDIVIKLPLPPGCLPTLWQNQEGFFSSYLQRHKGFYTTGDAGFIDDEGYLHIMSRIDDIINVAGHRLSTGAIEEVASDHSAIAECAVIGINDALKGELPLILAVLFPGTDALHKQIEAEVIQSIREKIGPIVSAKKLLVVDRLPKTRSGKILRGTLRKMANGEKFSLPATIDDPNILDVVKNIFIQHGFGKPVQSTHTQQS